MISHKHEFIFIQIPKTACTSVQDALRKYGCGNIEQGKNSWDKVDFKHITFGELENKIESSTLNAYFKFTFVRNPFDWLTSNYHWGSGGFHVPYIKREISEANRITDCFAESKSYLDIIESLREQKSMQISSMDFADWVKWYVNNTRGTQLEMIQNMKGTDSMDFIGKYENLQQDFDFVCDKIGIPRQELPHINTTEHKHYTEYYDDETRKIVAEKYRTDIEYFGYEYGE